MCICTTFVTHDVQGCYTNTNTNNFILDKPIQIEVTLLYVYIYTGIHI